MQLGSKEALLLRVTQCFKFCFDNKPINLAPYTKYIIEKIVEHSLELIM
jgi:hypothetical protein